MMMNRHQFLWLFSIVLSLLLLSCTGFIIYKFDLDYQPDPNQITNEQELADYLKSTWFKESPPNNQPILVPTGIFIQSVAFLTSNNVRIAGFVWQKYNKNAMDIENKGVKFVEGVEVTTNETYRRIEDDVLTIVWYFEGQFIQNFDYSDFPLDDKVVWVRMWHAEFDKNIVLIPDLKSYDSTLKSDHFGIEPEIVLAGFSLLETFFSFKSSTYDTNFGTKSFKGKTGFPELYYNISLERKVIDSAIIYFLPLITVIALMFLGVLLITVKEDELSFFGYSLLNMLNLASFLLFVIVLSHTQLRTQVTSKSIVYLEYIYITTYLAIIYAISIAFLIDKYCRSQKLALLGKNGIYARAAFLPLVSFAIFLTTYLTFSLR